MADYQITTGLPQLPSSGLDEKSFQLLAPVYQGMNGLAQELSVQAGKVSYTQDEMANLNQFAQMQRYKQRLFIKALVDLDYGKPLNLLASSGKICAVPTGYLPGVYGYGCHALCDEETGIAAGDFGSCIFAKGYCAGLTGAALMQQCWIRTDTGVIVTAPGSSTVFLGYGLASAGFYLSIGPG